MANPVLHIKDSYYFELPKFLVPSNYDSLQEFPDVWVSLDEEYQDWHFDQIYDELVKLDDVRLRAARKEDVRSHWRHWQHESHDNFGKPFDEYLEEYYQKLVSEFPNWKLDVHFEDMVKRKSLDSASSDLIWSFATWRHTASPAWNELRRKANNVEAFRKHCKDQQLEWSKQKLDAYNYHLSGKVLIPQPFGQLRNLYEAHPANHWYELCISKFMILEIVVAILIGWAFIWLARRVKTGAAPKGKLWNLLEGAVVFIRDQVAGPAIGHHDAHTYTPYLWTIFLFVLGCNLMGMIPWLGSPTGTFGVTLSFAALTLMITIGSGVSRFGTLGFFKNLVPHMDMPILMRIPIFLMLLVIEFVGLLIKHLVLAIRLLANMVAGHLVLLGIMGVAFSVEAVAKMSNLEWGIAAVISIAACTAFSLLELFVAFLQAYIITFLSALFIGSVLHEH